VEGKMDARVTWKQRMSFNGTANSGFDIPIGTSVEHGGDCDGTSPMEMVLIGLGGCTAMDVISILEKKRQDVTKFEVVLHADRAHEHPKVFTDITIEYVVTGHNVDPEAVKRSVELSEEKYCSVSGMLRKATTIRSKITIIEA
jgi:putative redox protein